MLKLYPRKLEPWFVVESVFLLRLLYLEMSDKLQKRLCRTVCPSLLMNPWLIVKTYPAYVFCIGITLVDVYLNWINWFLFLILEGGLLVILIDCILFLSAFLDVARIFVNSFFPCAARLWNSMPIECFPLTYDLNGFMSRINRHSLSVGL